jgi:hypothetical protein
MKKTTLFVTLTIFVIIELTACSIADDTYKEIDQPGLTDSTVLVTQAPSDGLDPTSSMSDLSSNEKPIVISHIESNVSTWKIFSYSLNSQSNYSTISVDPKTTFQGPAGIDDENNLYLIYGARENYVSRLSIDGKVETIELPYLWMVNSLWVGDKLFVLPISSDDSMAVINTDLQITTLSPAIDTLDDGTRGSGMIGISNTSPKIVVWTSSQPMEDETGEYAFYRTLSLETFEIAEFWLKIPDSNGNEGQYETVELEPDNRLDTMVIGVDLLNNNAILCYSYKGDERAIYHNIELFNSEELESIISFNYTCINNVLDLRGSTIIDNSIPDICGTTQVLSLSDLQPAFDLSKYIDYESGQIYWVSSNGNYWQIISNNEIIVINADKQLEARYPLSFSISINLIPGTTLLPAFLIDD